MVELEGKGNLSVSTPFRYEGVEEQLHAFVTSIFDTVCGQVYAWVPLLYFGEIASGAK
jgi:hypothetical protein